MLQRNSTYIHTSCAERYDIPVQDTVHAERLCCCADGLPGPAEEEEAEFQSPSAVPGSPAANGTFHDLNLARSSWPVYNP